MLGECLFNPPLFDNEFLGIHDYVNNTVMRADTCDTELRSLAPDPFFIFLFFLFLLFFEGTQHL